MCAVDFSVRGNELKRRIKVHGGRMTFLSHSVIQSACWLIFRAAPCFMYAADIIFIFRTRTRKTSTPRKNPGLWIYKHNACVMLTTCSHCMLLFSQCTLHKALTVNRQIQLVPVMWGMSLSVFFAASMRGHCTFPRTEMSSVFRKQKFSLMGIFLTYL